MGNSNSNSIYVQLHNASANSGSQVTGDIFVNLITPIKIKSLTIKITGQEKAQWTEWNTTTDTSSNGADSPAKKSEDYSGQNEMFKILLPLQQFKSDITTVGQFRFPFSFILPPNLPGSFVTKGTDYSCSTEYKVKGVLNVVGMLKSNLKHTVDLFVMEKPLFLEPVLAQDMVPVTVCCCVNKGTVLFQLQTPRNAYTAGEAVTVWANVKNDSRKNINRIVIEVYQVLTLQNGRGREFTKSIPVSQQSFPGVPKLMHQDNILLSVNLPHGLPQQSLGTIVRCYYYLQVKASISMATDPKIKIPVVIYQPIPQPVLLPQQPLNWNPQLLNPNPVVVPLPVPATPPRLNMAQFTNMQPIQYNPGTNAPVVAMINGMPMVQNQMAVR